MQNNPNILPFDGEVLLYSDFLSKQESDSCFKSLLHEVDWHQEPIKIFGKEVMQPRLTAWYGDTDKPYSYSGITMKHHDWIEPLMAIKEKAETISKLKFTGALLNLYRDGKDSMGWHRDNEKLLGPDPVIGSVSLGATRTFQLRNYTDKKVVRSIDLTHGSFLLMLGRTQECWEHQIPKTAKSTGMRINITFRIIL